jgi:hypothetical protein
MEAESTNQHRACTGTKQTKNYRNVRCAGVQGKTGMEPPMQQIADWLSCGRQGVVESQLGQPGAFNAA